MSLLLWSNKGHIHDLICAGVKLKVLLPEALDLLVQVNLIDSVGRTLLVTILDLVNVEEEFASIHSELLAVVTHGCQWLGHLVSHIAFFLGI